MAAREAFDTAGSDTDGACDRYPKNAGSRAPPSGNPKARLTIGPAQAPQHALRGYHAPRGAYTKASPQFIQDFLRAFQIGGVETLGEPTIGWRQQLAGFSAAALVAPQAG